MSLTLEEKIQADGLRARERAAEEHFFDEAQPFYPLGFWVNWRNPGHWDIMARQAPGKVSAWKAAHPEGTTSGGGTERAFRIRGEPGAVEVLDERWDPHRPHPRERLRFRSIIAAMLWIMEELMQEESEK